MKKFILLVFLFPLISYGKVFTLPSGISVNIENHGYKKVFEIFTTPSGIKVIAEKIIPTAYAEEPTLKDEIILYVRELTDKYKVNFKRVVDLIDCESRFNPIAINLRDIDNFKKYGLLQWYLPTYYGAGGKDWKNWKENLDIGIKMMADGYWKRWPVCSN